MARKIRIGLSPIHDLPSSKHHLPNQSNGRLASGHPLKKKMIGVKSLLGPKIAGFSADLTDTKKITVRPRVGNCSYLEKSYIALNFADGGDKFIG